VLAAILEATGSQAEPVFGEERVGDIPRCALSSRLAAAEIGWRAEVRFGEGIAQTVAWTKDYYGLQRPK
jgi:dTDP-L-rhamnose 4-epimerase